MIAEAELAEYLDEIRKQVCSRCVERPPGGPPCLPAGKECGIELHLPALIEAVRQIKSGSIIPYLENNQLQICETCVHLHDSMCPCPLHYLACLIVPAIEAVDERRQQQLGAALS
jgi:hypothetical protein